MAAMERGHVLSLWRGQAPKAASQIRDWTQQELAQFFRVEWALGEAGVSVESDRGISDEGDPWFAFCRAGDGEVIIHIAREGQVYVLAGFLSDRIQRGRDFNELVGRLLAEHPAKTLDKRGESNVIMHPATMLALLVLIAFLNSSESRAATGDGDAAAERAPAVPLVKPVGAVRPTGTLATAIEPLTATFELSQAMTILRVVSLLSSLPAVEHGSSPDADSHAGFAAGSFRPVNGGDSSAVHSSIAKPVLDAPAVAQAGVGSATTPILDHASGVEKLLEAVAKLWTYPDAKVSAEAGLTADAAAAFFSTAGTAEAITIVSSIQTKDLHKPLVPLPSDLSEKPTIAGSSLSLTIMQTSASSESMAQTLLKLSFPGQGDVIIHAAMLGSSDKLYETVSALVERAKGSFLPSADDTISLGSFEAPGASHDVTPGDAHVATSAGHAGSSEADASKTAATATHKSYTTVIADGMVKHVALDDSAQADVERAIAAFKEDVGQYSIAMNGKDVIFYSPDAVINHSSKVVVELWQFQDGSSIGLVGLSVDGHLPYSL